MPAVALAAVAYAAGYMSLQAFVVQVAMAALSMVMAESKKPDTPFDAEAKGRSRMLRSPVSPHRVIYGRAQVSGTMVYGTVTGDDPKYLHMVIVLSGRELTSIGQIYLNDKPILAEEEDANGNVIAGDYANHVRIKRHLGSPDQLADADLVAEMGGVEWTNDHRLRGRAYIYVRLKQNREVFATGVPNIKADVQGHAVYDPRSGQTVWSDNAALCALDYLRWSGGIGSPDSEIDMASWIAAANACDEAVSLGGSTQPRYTCNGTFTVDRQPIAVLEEIKSAMAGAVVWTMGHWEGYAGVAAPATGAISESDFRGSIQYRNKPGRDGRFNAVRGTFTDPQDHWQPTDFVQVANALYQQEDGGEAIYRDIALPFTTNRIEAQRIAKVELETHRQGLTATLRLKLGPGLKLKPWQVVTVTVPTLGWNGKRFRIRDWQLVPEDDGALGVDVQVQEYADAAYDWNMGQATDRDLAPNTNLPDPFSVGAPTNLALASGSDELLIAADGTVHSRIHVSWSLPADSGIIRTEVQYRKVGNAGWNSLPAARRGETSAWISPVKDGQLYDVRVRTVNLFLIPSGWLAVYGHQVVGKLAPPADVATLNVDRQPDGTRQFAWSKVSDPDLAGYEIRYRLGTGWSWQQMTPLHEGLLVSSPWETNLLAAGEYTLAIKARDTSGNESLNPRYVTSNLGDPRIGDALAYESPHLMGWPGTRTNCVPDDAGGALTAIGQYQWDDLSTWDGWPEWAQNHATQIAYEHPAIDLSAVAAFTPLASAAAVGNPLVEIDWSTDGVSWAGWQAAPPSITARYLKARVTVDQVDGRIPQVQTFTIVASGKTIGETVSDSDTSTWSGSAAAGRVVPIAKSYQVITSLRVALQSVGPGWSWEIVNKTPTGPTIRLYDNGTPADALVDVEVVGIPPTA